MLALSGVGGVVLGYVLRGLIGLPQRGSIELDIKQKLLHAQEQAAKVPRRGRRDGASRAD